MSVEIFCITLLSISFSPWVFLTMEVMQKISTDYEELKKAFESQKCPKDDKIQALRSTARALESENSLLQEAKGMIMRENTSNRASLEAKIQRLEAEGEEQRAALDRWEDAKAQLDL